MKSIDYTYVHEKSIELDRYLENLGVKITEQMHYDIEDIIRSVALNEQYRSGN